MGTVQTEQQPAGALIPRLANILVPTDFSPESLKALRYGVAFARQFNAALWLIHTLERPPVGVGLETVPIIVDDPVLIKQSERRLGELAAAHIPAGIPVNLQVRYGTAFEEVVSVAKDRGIDLIITSTHGHTGLKRVVFGSTTERIVQRAPCPMLVVREREHEFIADPAQAGGGSPIQLKRILVPVDFSDCSRKALQYAIALARQFQAEIVCLHVLEIPYGTGEAGVVIETEAFRKRLHEESKRQMADFLREQGVRISEECTIKLGTPYREIIQTADDRQIDLIILGTHGRAGVRHFLLGSTTERVVRHAHCPVLVVREREHEFLS